MNVNIELCPNCAAALLSVEAAFGHEAMERHTLKMLQKCASCREQLPEEIRTPAEAARFMRPPLAKARAGYATFELDASGDLGLYVATDEGAKVKLSDEQADFVKAAFFLERRELAPGDSVQFFPDVERLRAELGWSRERLVAVARSLEQLGVMTVRESAGDA